MNLLFLLYIAPNGRNGGDFALLRFMTVYYILLCMYY